MCVDTNDIDTPSKWTLKIPKYLDDVSCGIDQLPFVVVVVSLQSGIRCKPLHEGVPQTFSLITVVSIQRIDVSRDVFCYTFRFYNPFEECVVSIAVTIRDKCQFSS